MQDIVELVYIYLTDHRGKLNVTHCANDLNITSEEVKSALDTLQRSGKIKKTDEPENPPAERLLSEKKKLKSELKKLSSHQIAGKLTEEQYEKDSSAIKKKIEKLDNKITSIRRQKQREHISEDSERVKPAEVADLIKERDTISEWIDNLNNGKDSVSETAYDKLLDEYQSRLETIKTSIAQNIGKLLILWEENKSILESLSFNLEDLTARTVSGEIDKKYSTLRRDELERKMQHVKEEIELIEGILSKTGT